MNNDICICIPTLNESQSIESVITEFINEGYSNIFVIDGGSTDGTRKIADEAGAKVHTQEYHGNKGSAMREAVELIDEDIIVFVDGDLTYNASDINKLITPIIKDDFDHVLASRLADLQKESMSKLHIFGNNIINTLFFILYKKNVQDLLTGYRAIKKDSFKELNLNSKGFDIETELTAKSILNNHKIKTVPSTYYKRKGNSELNSFKDGFKIIKRMIITKFQ